MPKISLAPPACDCDVKLRHEGSWQAGALDKILSNNCAWAEECVAEDPLFFSSLVHAQTPEYLWIGCADSRVPANTLLGLKPGEVFVQRNVGNLATHKDLNCMACLEYAVEHLNVKHIIVCGHYNCGAVQAALTMPSRTGGIVNLWIQDIRNVRNQHADELQAIDDSQEQWDRLVELNVVSQLYNVCTSPTVQAAWDRGQKLAVHAVCYNLHDGRLKEIEGPISSVFEFEAFAVEQRAGHAATAMRMRVAPYVTFEPMRKSGPASDSNGVKATQPLVNADLYVNVPTKA